MTSRRLAPILLALCWAVLLTACGSSNSSSLKNGLADGTYVFHLAGEDYYSSSQKTSPYFAAGAFTVSGGAITAGEEDYIDYYRVFNTLAIQATGSSIAITTDGNLQILLNTGLEGVGINGVQTINAARVTSSSARIAEFDGFASGTGSLDLQSGVAQPSGGYAFFAAGVDTNALPLAMGGILNVDNLNGAGTISGAGSVFDLNNAPTLGLFAAQALSASAVSTADSFGRLLFTLNPGNTSIGQIQLVGYVVDSTTIQLVETRDGLLGTLGGTALSQGSNAGTFSNTSLSGFTYVAGGQGQEKVTGQSGTGYVVGAGYLNFAGALAFSAGALTGQVSFNDIDTQLAEGGLGAGASYSVDPTGRVTASGLSTANPNTPATLQFYLDGNGNTFVVSMDVSDVTAGAAFQQTDGATVSGSYALSASGAAVITTTINNTPFTTTYPWSAVGSVSAGSVSATGFTDLNVLTNPVVSGSATPDVSLSGTSSGAGNILTGTIGGLGYAVTANQYTYYVIDNNRALAIETDANQLSEAFAQTSTAAK